MTCVAGICLALMMFTVVGDVICRYVFNAPFGWSYDFIGLYLMVGVFFLSLSAALADHHHIAVDLVGLGQRDEADGAQLGAVPVQMPAPQEKATIEAVLAEVGAEWAENMKQQGKPGKKVLEAFRDALPD